MSAQETVIQNVMSKLDQLPFYFENVDSDLIPCLNDTLRELKITDISEILDGSDAELYIEIRTEWWYLHRKRNSESIRFRYTTGSDGRSVDKAMVPKMIGTIMGELDAQYRSWKRTYNRTTGSIWNKDRRASASLQGM